MIRDIHIKDRRCMLDTGHVLHPETRAAYEGGRFKGNQYSDLVADKMSATKKSFVRNTAKKLGVERYTRPDNMWTNRLGIE